MQAGDAQVLWRMLRGQPAGADHRERLERFYAPQARHYDAFRERLLHGRAAMLEALCLEPGQHVVELGCGTARNLEYLHPDLRAGLTRIDAVDLCAPLLARARTRCAGWTNVSVCAGDATTWDPGAPVDRVYFSYALTMIPNWRTALRNAYRMLRPGGLIGVVDFAPADRAGEASREPWQNAFWRRWFAHDGVTLDRAHGAYLDGLFERIRRSTHRSSVPWVPLLKVPYYIFIGRK